MVEVYVVSVEVTLNVVNVIVGGRWAFSKTADPLVFSHWHNKPLCSCILAPILKNHLTLVKLTVTFFLLLETVHRAFCPLGTAERMPVSVWTFFNGHASACSACHSLC